MSLREHIRQRRQRKLRALNERYWNLTVALDGINYSMHPFDYEQIALERTNVRNRIDKLDTKLKEN